MSGTYEAALDAAVRSDNPPDVFVPRGAASLSKLIDMGWVIPIDDVAPSKAELKSWLDTFPKAKQPFVENTNMFGGKVYSWPNNGDRTGTLLFWNTKLFRDAGLKAADGGPKAPETWADMRLFARKITEQGQGKTYGIVHGIKSSFVWNQDLFMGIAVAAGVGDLVSGFDFKTGRFDDYQKPGFERAFHVWLDMKKDGSIFPGDLSMDDEQAKFKFAQDLAGMIFGGEWVPGGLMAVNDSLEFDCVLPPTEERGVRKGYASSARIAESSEYVVSSKIKSGDAVWKVITFMTSAQYQEGWVKAGGGISVFPQYNKPEYFQHPTIGKIAELSATATRTTPVLPAGTDELWSTYISFQPGKFETAEGIWIGTLELDKAWDDYSRKCDELFDVALAEARKAGRNLTRADHTFPDWDPTENYPPLKAKKE